MYRKRKQNWVYYNMQRLFWSCAKFKFSQLTTSGPKKISNMSIYKSVNTVLKLQSNLSLQSPALICWVRGVEHSSSCSLCLNCPRLGKWRYLKCRETNTARPSACDTNRVAADGETLQHLRLWLKFLTRSQARLSGHLPNTHLPSVFQSHEFVMFHIGTA